MEIQSLRSLSVKTSLAAVLLTSCVSAQASFLADPVGPGEVHMDAGVDWTSSYSRHGNSRGGSAGSLASSNNQVRVNAGSPSATMVELNVLTKQRLGPKTPQLDKRTVMQPLSRFGMETVSVRAAAPVSSVQVANTVRAAGAVTPISAAGILTKDAAIAVEPVISPLATTPAQVNAPAASVTPVVATTSPATTAADPDLAAIPPAVVAVTNVVAAAVPAPGPLALLAFGLLALLMRGRPTR